MIISEQWLREWVEVDLTAVEIADCLTNAGLEVDGVQPLAGEIAHLVIGHVKTVSKHPDADRLSLVAVDIGNEVLDIVCGASNVTEGLKVAVATVGAELPLPNGLKIKRAKVRGVQSNGMLCSAAELGLEESSDGILELSADAPIGQAVDAYLGLDDQLIDIDLTPNRGDCLSVQGIARELKFLANGKLQSLNATAIAEDSDKTVDIELADGTACPKYLARVITNLDLSASTPVWMTERLRRSGVRPISPVVDITNYVMLELGQPMHAFDANKLNGGIVIRQSLEGEEITLLDDTEAKLDGKTLVIADKQGPIAIAGVMGGAGSAIDDNTADIVLEAAHFTRKSAAGRARYYGLNTESSHRFERGVDPLLPERAMARATQLVLEICGGEAGPICTQVDTENLIDKPAVAVRLSRLERLLGMALERVDVAAILRRIADQVEDTSEGWLVTPPSYRFDLEVEADLVEEVARVKGYDNIPTAIPRLAPQSMSASELSVTPRLVRQTMVARDFHEAITYSFIDLNELTDFSAEQPVALSNPLADNMSVMRTSLLPGLVKVAQFNQNRQNSRLRFFEIGSTYHHAIGEQSGENPRFIEVPRLAALVSGPRHTSQWGVLDDPLADFFDLKADLEALLSLTGKGEVLIFDELTHSALHPGQASRVRIRKKSCGVIGRLHPNLESKYGFASGVYVVEIDLNIALAAKLPAYTGISKFPSIRRDLSLLVSSELPVSKLLFTARKNLGNELNNVNVFDVYQGKGVELGFKSVSLSLILQDKEKTMTDEHADALIDVLLEELKTECEATLRA